MPVTNGNNVTVAQGRQRVRLSGWHEGVAAVALGAVHATSFAPDPLPAWALAFVQVFSMAALAILVWRSAHARRAAALGFAFGLGTFATGLYWLHTSIHVHGGVAWLPAALAVWLLAAFEALYTAAATALAWRLGCSKPIARQARAADRGAMPSARGLTTALAWASSWTLLEWLRGTLFTGFPWLNVAYAHTDGVLAGWASIVGAYGVAWFAAFVAATLALLIRAQGDRGNTTHASTTYGAHASTPVTTRTRLDASHGTASHWSVVLIASVSAVCGALLPRIAWETDHGPALTVRLVQGNVPQSEKFDPVLLRQHLDHYRALVALAPKDGGAHPDLIVLPETVIPVLQDRLPAEEWRRWRELARLSEATLLIGAPVHTVRDGRNVYTNSVVALDGATDLDALIYGRAARYDKSHLVPFGEFIPTGFRWFVEAMTIPLGDFDRGAARQRLFAIAGQTVAPNICYEDVFGEDILHAVRPSAAHGDAGASVLINFSNLAWFGDSWALRQHVQMARMRSMETRRPMLRATNTGMTAAISPQGVVYAALPAQHVGVLDVQVQGVRGLTPYVRFGNAPILAWLAMTLLMLCVRARRNG